MEEWRPVLNFEGLYEVSSQGNLRRVARGKTLTAERVAIVKQMLSQGAKLIDIAAQAGTSIATVSNIKRGKTWAGDENWRPIRATKGKDHYLYFRACKEGQYSAYRVHRAVWEAFNGPIPGRLEVNHINLIRDDNRLENLELLTHQQNVQHAFAIYTREQAGQPKRGRGSPRGRYFKHT